MKSDLNSLAPSPVHLLQDVERLKSTLGNNRCVESDEEAAAVHYELQGLLKKILLADLEYALDHKVEQDLWNTVFKNQITIMQAKVKDKKSGATKQKEWQATLYVFLDAALGFYTLLLNSLCQMYNIDLPFRRKDSKLGVLGQPSPPPQPASGAARPSRSSCYYMVQDCLVHMGDIARYRGKIKQAESLYRHAVQLVPSSGQPYNQLALLEAQHGDRVSPVYYYVRSVAVKNPFPAATTNLSRLYDRIARGQADQDRPAGRGRLTAAQYTALFLELHAGLQQRITAADQASRVLYTLADSLPRLLVTEALSSWRLLQMLAINLYAISDSSGHLLLDQPGCSTLLHLIASTLDALLKITYRATESDSLAQHYCLPVIVLYTGWVSETPQVLTSEPFSTRPQLWAHLCHLVNRLGSGHPPLEEGVVLPEEQELAGFLPLGQLLRGLKFSPPSVCTPAAQTPLRAARLRAACSRLVRYGVMWTAGPNGLLESGYQSDPAQVLLELEEQTADKPSRPSPPPVAAPPQRVEEMRRGEPQTSRAGILKSADSASSGRRRQNVALQAIMRSGQRSADSGDGGGDSGGEKLAPREGRQVKFRTPSPAAAEEKQQQQQQQQPYVSASNSSVEEYLSGSSPIVTELRGPADSWRQPPSPAAVPTPPSVWPPPRPKHPLQQPPMPFNPAVPPPWPAGPAGFEPLKPVWSGWQQPAQPNPLAAILNQCRPGLAQIPVRQPDASQLARQLSDSGHLGRHPTDTGQVERRPADAGQVGRHPTDTGQMGRQLGVTGHIGRHPGDVGQVGRQGDMGQMGRHLTDPAQMSRQLADPDQLSRQLASLSQMGRQLTDPSQMVRHVGPSQMARRMESAPVNRALDQRPMAGGAADPGQLASMVRRTEPVRQSDPAGLGLARLGMGAADPLGFAMSRPVDMAPAAPGAGLGRHGGGVGKQLEQLAGSVGLRKQPDPAAGTYSLFPSGPSVPAYSLFPSGLQQQSLWPTSTPSPLERLIEQQRRQGPPGNR